MVEVINDDVSLTAIRAPAVKDELATRQRSLTTLITLTAMKGVDGCHRARHNACLRAPVCRELHGAVRADNGAALVWTDGPVVATQAGPLAAPPIALFAAWPLAHPHRPRARGSLSAEMASAGGTIGPQRTASATAVVGQGAFPKVVECSGAARGGSGFRGAKGESGANFLCWKVDRKNFVVVPLMSDGREGPRLHLRELFEEYHNQARARVNQWCKKYSTSTVKSL